MATLPHNLEAAIEHAYSLAKNGRMEEAEATYVMLLADHPDDPRILSTLGALLFRKGNLADARTLIEKSLHFDPAQAKALANLSAILFNQGELDGALAAIDRAIAQGNPTSETWNNRGIILNALGRSREALCDLDKAMAINADNVEALYNKATVLQKMEQISEAIVCYRKVVESAPYHAGAQLNLAVLQASQGDREAALDRLSQLLAARPDYVDAFIQRGRLMLEADRLEEALSDTNEAVRLAPNHIGAIFQNGWILKQLGELAQAAACFERIRQHAPRDPYNLLALGSTRYELRDYAAALEAFDTLIEIAPNFPDAYNNKGLVLQELKQYDDAIDHYKQAIELQSEHLDALYNLANTLREQEAFEESLGIYDRLLAIEPKHLNGLKNKGATLGKLKRHEEALDTYNQVLAFAPGDADAYFNASTALLRLDKPEMALNYANKAYKIDPESADALYTRALVLMRFGLISHALTDAQEAMRLKPRHALTNFLMGTLHEELKQPIEALQYFGVALEENENIEYLRGKIAHHRMFISDWQEFEETVKRILTLLDANKPACQPFELHSLVDAPEYHRKAAELFYRDRYRVETVVEIPQHTADTRIRVGYFSSDIGAHPVANLMAGVFEAHDRSQFEITLFLLDNHSDGVRDRVVQACERTINAEFMSDEDIVALARSLKIDIAVDLNGFTSRNRTGVFARRAAPLQLNYIGFLGTMGSDCHDYIIADQIIAPIEHQDDFSEKIIHLPCYQANDDRLTIPPTVKTREDYGLPADAFVFCSFNANYKITPPTFDSWMKILQRVPGSVLWLHCKRDDAIANMRASATARGIAAERLVFARNVPYAEHLARHRLADLFLDTNPYNAGATASNALFCGLPIITLTGRSFCSRYGASLLSALQLQELITETSEAYIALGAKIGNTPGYCAELKEKLAHNLKTSPLFQTTEFTKNLEKAYRAIHTRHHQNLPPAHMTNLEPVRK